MIKNVSDLIETLKKFNGDIPIFIRLSDVTGYLSDWTLQDPNYHYTSSALCLRPLEEYQEAKNSND